MAAKWTDDMVRDYYYFNLNATLREIAVLSGRSEGDVIRIIMKD